MNFSYGVIAAVGVLAAISIGFISMEPNEIIEPRIVETEENLVACTLQWDPMCGVDGETYGNMCQLDAANAKLDYQGECVVEPISVTSYIMPKTATVGETLLIEVEFRDDDKKIVDHVNYDISASQNDESILSEPGSHRHPGMHPIHETTILDESSVEILVVIQGLGHGEEITEPKGIESSISVIPEAATEPTTEPTTEPPTEPTTESLPMTAIVSLPPGSAIPGCDDTNECYLPYEINVAIGATVSWSNDDSAAHTVTSGTVDAGVTGVFDSSLFMAGDVYEFTFDETGTYDYFCMVHPWMTGIVNVN